MKGKYISDTTLFLVYKDNVTSKTYSLPYEWKDHPEHLKMLEEHSEE